MSVIQNPDFPKIQKNRQSITTEILFWLRSLISFDRPPKIHDYQMYERGIDYFFDVAHPANTAMMTGTGRGIKIKDWFLLSVDGKVCKYRVEEIDYYASPDFWIVSLKKDIEPNFA